MENFNNSPPAVSSASWTECVPVRSVGTYFQLLLGVALILDRHLALVLLEVLSLGGLQIEPGVTEIAYVGQQGLDERMVLVLGGIKKTGKSGD